MFSIHCVRLTSTRPLSRFAMRAAAWILGSHWAITTLGSAPSSGLGINPDGAGRRRPPNCCSPGRSAIQWLAGSVCTASGIAGDRGKKSRVALSSKAGPYSRFGARLGGARGPMPEDSGGFSAGQSLGSAIAPCAGCGYGVPSARGILACSNSGEYCCSITWDTWICRQFPAHACSAVAAP